MESRPEQKFTPASYDQVRQVFQSEYQLLCRQARAELPYLPPCRTDEELAAGTVGDAERLILDLLRPLRPQGYCPELLAAFEKMVADMASVPMLAGSQQEEGALFLRLLGCEVGFEDQTFVEVRHFWRQLQSAQARLWLMLRVHRLRGEEGITLSMDLGPGLRQTVSLPDAITFFAEECRNAYQTLAAASFRKVGDKI